MKLFFTISLLHIHLYFYCKHAERCDNLHEAPDDISVIGEELNNQAVQFANFNFPVTKHGQQYRSCNINWMVKYSWLEYSVSRDSLFCYPCRQFITDSHKRENTYTPTGYKNWKHATDKSKGLGKHNDSKEHIAAMAAWQEKKNRLSTNAEIAVLLSGNVLEKRRYYMKAIIEVIVFLVQNELALRGSWDSDEYSETGLFTNLFEFSMRNDEKLAQCQAVMPRNALYTSPNIQNEIIEIMVDLVRQQIVDEILNADINFYSILADGTTDRKSNEIISLAIRYVKDGKPKETVLSLEFTAELDAKSLTDVIHSSLVKYGLEPTHILSQCYDGANVMRGCRGGVQKMLQDKIGKCIPYTHCFNHQLHLIIIALIRTIELLRHFFDQLKVIYEFFKRIRVRKIYSGKTVLRLIDTRWSGHAQATNAILNTYADIVDTLPKI